MSHSQVFEYHLLYLYNQVFKQPERTSTKNKRLLHLLTRQKHHYNMDLCRVVLVQMIIKTQIYEWTLVYEPCHQDSGNLRSKSLGHLSAAHVSDAVQGQVHEGRVAAAEVILNGVVDQTNQVAVGVHQNWDEQVTLEDTGNATRIKIVAAATDFHTITYASCPPCAAGTALTHQEMDSARPVWYHKSWSCSRSWTPTIYRTKNWPFSSNLELK